MNNHIKTSCIVPAFNEEGRINKVISALVKAKKAGLINEIIVVSDGSKDQTADEAKKAGADVVLDLQKNIGKAGAMIEGFKAATGEIFLMIDADLVNLTASHIELLIKSITEENCDMVMGYLVDDKNQSILRHLTGQRALSSRFVAKILLDKKITKKRYQIEIILNRKAKRFRFKTQYVPLIGLGHITKDKKSSFFKSLFYTSRSMSDLILAYRNHAAIVWIVALAALSYVLFFSPIKLIGKSLTEIPNFKHGQKILVVVAHPDDEVIGAGGVIANAIKNKAQVRVVIATNGDANKFSARVLDKNVILNSKDYSHEGVIRMSESESALKILGLDRKDIYYLSFPDRELNFLLKKNWSTTLTSKYTKKSETSYREAYKNNIAYTGKNLESLIEEVIGNYEPDVVITHFIKDHNSDHQAVSRLTRLAILSAQTRELVNKPQVYTFLVHWKISDYPHPLRFASEDPLLPPKELSNDCDWQIYPLSKNIENIKLTAMNQFKSQLDSPYLYLLLKSFIRTNELFCRENYSNS